MLTAIPRNRNGPENTVTHNLAIGRDLGRHSDRFIDRMARERTRPAPRSLHHVEAGEGETVLLVHGSAASSGLWHSTIQALQPLYRTVAPDLIGYGGSPSWPARIPYRVDSETDALRPLLPCGAEKYHLVGHSYGGLVALMLALGNPVRVRTLTLIEPMVLAALRHDDPALRRFAALRDAFLSALAGGRREEAMGTFVDFWGGKDAWQRASTTQRSRLMRSADKIALEWRAAFAAGASLNPLADLGPRTRLLRGDRSPASMLSLVEALHRLMPGSTLTVVPGAGHSLPATHTSEMIGAMMSHFHVEAERRLR